MTLSLGDVVALEGGGGLRRSRRSKREYTEAPFSLSRRGFLGGALTLGSAAAISTLSWLPLGRPAYADHGAWDIWHSCDELGYAQNDNCDGCQADKAHCCCQEDNGFHKFEGCRYSHRPNRCKDGHYDAWLWRYNGCCAISCSVCWKEQRWRCSDGFRRSDCDAEWRETICKYRLEGVGCNCGSC